jgi:transcriptional regulator with XRE-family HTH domain
MMKTYKNFGEALDILRVEHDLSYERLSIKLGIANSYVYNMINRRTKSAPSNELIEKIASIFQIEPTYFYEYRLRKMLGMLDSNREFLDHCEKEFKKWVKPAKRGQSPTEPEQDEATA